MIRRVIPLVAALLVLGVGVSRGPGARADGRTATTEVECGILLPGILPAGQVLATTGFLVVTAAGTATLTCRGRLEPGLAPARAALITDVPCALGEGGQVGESLARVSPSGEVLLVCQNNPGSEPFPTPGPDD